MDRKAKSDLTSSSSTPRSQNNDGDRVDKPAAKVDATPSYMRSTSATANKRTTPAPVLQRTSSFRAGGSGTKSFQSQDSSSRSDSSKNVSKKTSTPLRKGGKLDFSNASSIADQTAASSAVQKMPVLTTRTGPAVEGVAKMARITRRQSVATLPRGPLRVEQASQAKQTAHNDDMEFEMRRSQLICSLRLVEKAKAADAAVERQGLRAIWHFFLMGLHFRKDISALRERKGRLEALLPIAKQLKVFVDGMEQILTLKDDIELTVSGVSLKEAEKVLKEAEEALKSPALDKLPLLVQALQSYQNLAHKLDRIVANSDKCYELIKAIEEVDVEDEKYRKFAQLIPIEERNSPLCVTGMSSLIGK